MISARREYLLSLALGAAGAALVLLSVRQGWARVLTPNPAPLPASSEWVRGQDLAPAAAALGLASLAGLVAVAATRRRGRRLTGLLLAVLGLVMAVSIGVHTSSASVVAAARERAVSQAGSATAGGSGVAPGTVPGGAAPGVTAAGHVTPVGFPWQAVALAGALIVTGAGVLTAWRGGRWPAMSSRYDRSAPPARGGPAPRGPRSGGPAPGDPAPRGSASEGPAPPGPRSGGPAPGGPVSGCRAPAGAMDAATLWDALSSGADPTGPTGSTGRGPG
jgi:uncharacterized membrane protein (TIGR02234 family)